MPKSLLLWQSVGSDLSDKLSVPIPVIRGKIVGGQAAHAGAQHWLGMRLLLSRKEAFLLQFPRNSITRCK